ncbi:MAG: hypothetical protein RL227_1794 [Pseudomonadota bacterium]
MPNELNNPRTRGQAIVLQFPLGLDQAWSGAAEERDQVLFPHPTDTAIASTTNAAAT